jgi:hypothetical protein
MNYPPVKAGGLQFGFAAGKTLPPAPMVRAACAEGN